MAYPDDIYIVTCATCDFVSKTEWFSLAKSNADWHNTMNGHVDIKVTDSESQKVVYDMTC